MEQCSEKPRLAHERCSLLARQCMEGRVPTGCTWGTRCVCGSSWAPLTLLGATCPSPAPCQGSPCGAGGPHQPLPVQTSSRWCWADTAPALEQPLLLQKGEAEILGFLRGDIVSLRHECNPTYSSKPKKICFSLCWNFPELEISVWFYNQTDINNLHLAKEGIYLLF